MCGAVRHSCVHHSAVELAQTNVHTGPAVRKDTVFGVNRDVFRALNQHCLLNAVLNAAAMHGESGVTARQQNAEQLAVCDETVGHIHFDAAGVRVNSDWTAPSIVQ